MVSLIGKGEMVEHRHLTQKRDLQRLISDQLVDVEIRQAARRTLFILEGIIKVCSEAKAKGLCCYEDAIKIIDELDM